MTLHYTAPLVSAQEDILDGRYRIRERIGIGGMGEVYRAERVRLGDDVAIKFVRTDTSVVEDSRRRFMAEGRALAALRHPNIVSVIDFGIDEERGPFLVMEHLSGPSLAEEIAASGPLELDKAIRITTDLAAAIDLAHGAGLIHRDLKPANIVAHRYANGELTYKIVDFGIGTVIRTAASTTTAPARIFASLPYAAPEQLVGEDVDRHADVYGLGALAFEMLTGRPPFEAGDATQLLVKVMFGEAPRPSALRPTLDPRVDKAVLTALEKDVRRRWQSASAFASALAGIPSSRADGVEARPTTSLLLERYELGERIDTGRLGSEVYAARHRAIRNSVVVRILRRSAAPGWAAACARFLREAQTMQIAHPSILQVRDYGEEPDLVYIVTDRVGGISLRQLIDAEAPLAWARAHQLIAGLLSAAHAIHKRGGLVFGLTPSTIRVHRSDSGERLVMSSAGVADVQEVLATAHEDRLRSLEVSTTDLLSRAPELLLGEDPDGRADIYTLGTVAYEMLTGRPPFAAFTITQLVAQIVAASYDSARQLSPMTPGDAVLVIDRCLAFRPDRRHATLAELEEAWHAIPPARQRD